jgi:flagellar basal body-associated protein FliL
MLISFLESELDAVQMVAETARLIVSYFVNFFQSLVRFASLSLVNMALVFGVFAAVGVGLFFVFRRSRKEVVEVEEQKAVEAAPGPEVLDEYVVDELLRVQIVNDKGVYKYLGCGAGA